MDTAQTQDSANVMDLMDALEWVLTAKDVDAVQRIIMRGATDWSSPPEQNVFQMIDDLFGLNATADCRAFAGLTV